MQPLEEKILDHVSGRRGTTPATLLYSLLVNVKFRKPWWDTQETWYMIPHILTKMQNKYSHKWNCEASFPIFTFLCLWFPRSVRLVCCIAFANWLWKYIYKSLTVEIGMRPHSFILRNIWSNFRDSAFAMQPLVEKIMGHVSGSRRTTPATQIYKYTAYW
jgi:hypothetical protein